MLLQELAWVEKIDWSRVAIDSSMVAAKGGNVTGPNPTDKGRPGCRRHLVVDAQGIPLAVCLAKANLHDSQMFATMLDAIPALWGGGRGRPRRRPD